MIIYIYIHCKKVFRYTENGGHTGVWKHLGFQTPKLVAAECPLFLVLLLIYGASTYSLKHLLCLHIQATKCYIT